MPMRYLAIILAILLPLGQEVALAGAYKGPFTGVFYGQGEGCWGGLFIRTRTIQWYPGNLMCKRTVYTIIDQRLHTPFENDDHIVFKLDHVNKGCPFPYIGLYYYQPLDEIGPNGKTLEGLGTYYDWSVMGFESYRQYKNFPYKGFLNDTIYINPSDLMYCNLPYTDAPFPYGSPLTGPCYGHAPYCRKCANASRTLPAFKSFRTRSCMSR